MWTSQCRSSFFDWADPQSDFQLRLPFTRQSSLVEELYSTRYLIIMGIVFYFPRHLFLVFSIPDTHMLPLRAPLLNWAAKSQICFMSQNTIRTNQVAPNKPIRFVHTLCCGTFHWPHRSTAVAKCPTQSSPQRLTWWMSQFLRRCCWMRTYARSRATTPSTWCGVVFMCVHVLVCAYACLEEVLLDKNLCKEQGRHAFYVTHVYVSMCAYLFYVKMCTCVHAKNTFGLWLNCFLQVPCVRASQTGCQHCSLCCFDPMPSFVPVGLLYAFCIW